MEIFKIFNRNVEGHLRQIAKKTPSKTQITIENVNQLYGLGLFDLIIMHPSMFFASFDDFDNSFERMNMHLTETGRIIGMVLDKHAIEKLKKPYHSTSIFVDKVDDELFKIGTPNNFMYGQKTINTYFILEIKTMKNTTFENVQMLGRINQNLQDYSSFFLIFETIKSTSHVSK